MEKNSQQLTDVSKMTRDDVVPFYRWMVLFETPQEEIIRVNQLILSKWTKSGLIYIKEKAWKGVELL